MNCPCKGCTKRWISETSRCHSSCKEYKDWNDLLKQQKGLFNKRKVGYNSAGEVLFGKRRKR